jgi:orotate phosphoribosyltransferase
MKNEEMLQIFLDTGALLKGHFELRSGLHSDQYFQCALVLRYPRIAERLCAALVDRIRREQPAALAAQGVIAPAMGGLFVGHEIARALDLPFLFAEKQDNKLVLRRGFGIQPGGRYLVAEDVITRGGRVQETIDIVEQRGGKVSGIAVIVDRSGGKARFAHPTFSLLQMEPVTYPPNDCPLCRAGKPMDHPGS